MGGRLTDLHEPGQLPHVCPLTVPETAEGSVQGDDASATGTNGESETTEPGTAAFFRQVTPDDQRIHLPKALDWMMNGMPVKTPWGERRMPIPIAGIFRGSV